MGDGTVLGMRVVTIAPSDVIDTTVSFASVSDRLARDGAAAVLSVPPTTVRAPWSGLTPPRDGWEPVGQLDGEVIDSIARQGISQVAEGTPENAGGHAVESLRRRTWGAMSDTVPPIARRSRVRRPRARLHHGRGAGVDRGPRPVDASQHVARSRARPLT